MPSIQAGEPFVQCDFEISPFDPKLKGYIRAEAFEKGGQDPTSIIASNQDWYIDVEWDVVGGLVHHLCGKWCLTISIESIGPGAEVELSRHIVDFNPCQEEPEPYRYRCNVPAGEVKAGDCGTLYLVAVMLTSLDACGNPGHFAAYCKDLCLMFYVAPHQGEEEGE